MRELRLVGSSADGSTLVLADATGEEFRVRVDGRLRAALRADRARLAQLETEMDSLRPRDIQARIRAGASPEELAEDAQVPIERVTAYAVPVLAERQHIAERARRSPVRRRPGEGHGRPLGEWVAEQLGGAGTDPASAEWDAWRRDDGRWTVSVAYRSGEHERQGLFLYDVGGRYSLTDNDDAGWLVGDPPDAGGTRRLAAVPAEAVEALLADEESTVDLTETVAQVRASEEHGQPAGVAEDAAGDDMAAIADVISAPADGEPEAGPAEQTGRRRPRRERRRASVPSWDEIMFGRRKDQ